MRIADVGRRVGEQRRVLHDGRGLDVAVAGGAADGDVIAGVADVRQVADPPDVDEHRRLGQAQLHQRSRLWPPARNFASSPCSPISEIASSALAARTYWNRGGDHWVPPEAAWIAFHTLCGEAGMGTSVTPGKQRVGDGVDHGRRGADRAASPMPFTPSGFVGEGVTVCRS